MLPRGLQFLKKEEKILSKEIFACRVGNCNLITSVTGDTC